MTRRILAFLLMVFVLSAGFAGCSNDGKVETTNDTQFDTNPETTESIPVEEALKQLPDIGEMSYPQYNALTPELQEAIKNTFNTDKEFVDWYSGIKEEHEAFEELLDSKPTTDATTDSTDTTTPTEKNPEADDITFLEYQAMSASEQKKFIASFGSIDAFMKWHSDAVQKYKDEMTEWGSSNKPTDPTIEIEG